VKLFWQKKTESISEKQGVPEGTFRCEICGFIQPTACHCGTAADGTASPAKVYTICSACALWLGMGTSRFPQGTTFNLSDRQLEKIAALRAEIEKCGGFDAIISQITASTAFDAANIRNISEVHENFKQTHVFLDSIPTLKGLIKFRFSMLPANIIEISGKLTRWEYVPPKEIRKANK
jgi:hypothetical protein